MTDSSEHQIGYKVLPRGVPVETTDGVEIGTVYRVLDNEREHIFDGIVVKRRTGRRVRRRARGGPHHRAAA